MNTTTDKAAVNDHLIRALYAAKAEFKDASSDLLSAQHNLCSMAANFFPQDELTAGRKVVAEQEARYDAAEKTYNAIWKLCNKMGLCG